MTNAILRNQFPHVWRVEPISKVWIGNRFHATLRIYGAATCKLQQHKHYASMVLQPAAP